MKASEIRHRARRAHILRARFTISLMCATGAIAAISAGLLIGGAL